jgi:hypothetical protein
MADVSMLGWSRRWRERCRGFAGWRNPRKKSIGDMVNRGLEWWLCLEEVAHKQIEPDLVCPAGVKLQARLLAS